jgi:hypothetical protein
MVVAIMKVPKTLTVFLTKTNFDRWLRIATYTGRRIIPKPDLQDMELATLRKAEIEGNGMLAGTVGPYGLGRNALKDLNFVINAIDTLVGPISNLPSVVRPFSSRSDR